MDRASAPTSKPTTHAALMLWLADLARRGEIKVVPPVDDKVVPILKGH